VTSSTSSRAGPDAQDPAGTFLPIAAGGNVSQEGLRNGGMKDGQRHDATARISIHE
jgi:hypothetical protein